MENFTPISATFGGILIGISAVWLMAANGRIAGISGILGGLSTAKSDDRGWRVTFLIGLIGAPFLLGLIKPDLLKSDFTVSLPLVALAGLLVGIGTTLGNGCTSGHGVCGNARLSIRSLLATITFMTTGVITVFIVRHVVGA